MEKGKLIRKIAMAEYSSFLMRCERDEKDEEEELVQVHGGHLRAITGSEVLANARIAQLIKEGEKSYKVRTEISLDELKSDDAEVIGISHGEDDIKFTMLLVADEKNNRHIFATMYPVLKGMTHEVTVDRVREWDNRIEATIECHIGDFHFAFFASDYFVNKQLYQKGVTVEVDLALLAEQARHGKEGFSLEGQEAVDWFARMGEEPDYDENGNVVPVHFSHLELVAFMHTDSKAPDEAEFHSPVTALGQCECLGISFHKVRVSICNQQNNLYLPLYFRKDFIPELDEHLPILGWAWTIGTISGDNQMKISTSEDDSSRERIHPWISITEKDNIPAGRHELKTLEWHEYDANCRWIDIEETLNDCYGADSDDTDRCVILCKQGQNTYVQTSYDNDNGIERWRLEWRVTQPDGSYRHYYGVDKTPESRYHELVCDLRTVMETFHYFYVTGGTVLPTEKLEWYEMDLTRSDE